MQDCNKSAVMRSVHSALKKIEKMLPHNYQRLPDFPPI